VEEGKEHWTHAMPARKAPHRRKKKANKQSSGSMLTINIREASGGRHLERSRRNKEDRLSSNLSIRTSWYTVSQHLFSHDANMPLALVEKVSSVAQQHRIAIKARDRRRMTGRDDAKG